MFKLNPIGRIKTPYEHLKDCPNNVEAEGPECEVVLDVEFAPGLKGILEGQSILLLYWFEGVDRSLVTQQVGQKSMVGKYPAIVE